MNKLSINMLMAMRTNTIENYIVPGLSSSLIGGKSGHGCVRLFESSRDQQEHVTPHSHRFDFQCLVLRGYVENTIWTQMSGNYDNGDEFQISRLIYKNKVGEYHINKAATQFFRGKTNTHNEGATYSMKAEEIHSIKFSRGAKVLFFEGPQLSNSTVIIEPVVDGVCIPTFEVKEWMFRDGIIKDREEGKKRMQAHNNLVDSEHGEE